MANAYVKIKSQIFHLPDSFGAEGEVSLVKLMETKKGVFQLGVLAGTFPYIRDYLEHILTTVVEPTVAEDPASIHGTEPDARLPGGRSNTQWIHWHRAINGCTAIESRDAYESKFGKWR